MKRTAVVAVALALMCSAARPQTSPAASQPQASTASPEPGSAEGDQKHLDQMRTAIAGHEKEPASQAFKNIQMFKQMPAERLPMVMTAFTKTLGVHCEHCHDTQHFDTDTKQKQIARDMAKMVGTINNDLLKNIANLKGPNPHIACYTCHRGQVKPETDIPK